MRKIYHLASCSTCQRIIKELKLDEAKFEFQDIKTENITPAQLEEMHAKTGSYEALFSKRAMKYREWNLGAKDLTEADIKDLILKEYTFLKRPVIWVDDQLFVGNTAKVIAAAREAIAR
ncbi:MAG: hypothetical protein KDC12_05995 [Flavobacteriales bacterium]|nr:hypothetical protein [Flavobacteriales bacterium]